MHLAIIASFARMSILNFVIFIRLTLICNMSLGLLTNKPANQVRFSNRYSNFSMMCSSSLGSNAIFWNFTLFGTTNEETVAIGSTLDPKYEQLYFIDQPSSSDSNLVIRMPSYYTAGTYVCADNQSVASAQFITVNISDIGCDSNVSAAGIYPGEIFSISCYVGYFGNDYISPIIQPFLGTPQMKAYNATTTLTKNGSTTYASGTFTDVADCNMNSTGVFYYAYFNQINGPLPPNSASNAGNASIYSYPGFTLRCALPVSSMAITGANSNDVVYSGTWLTCNATSYYYPLSYNWTDLTYGNSTNESTVGVWYSGSYRCTAYYYTNGLLYSASETLFNLTVAPFMPRVDPLRGPIAGGTNITITLNLWSQQTTNISAVYLGTDFQLSVISTNRSQNQIVVTTPNTTSAFVGQSFPITIELLPGPSNFTTKDYFVYLDNPEIYNITPQQFTVTGGTLLTVIGSNLWSVAYPVITMTLVEKRVNETPWQEITSESCVVSSTDWTQALCRIPPVNISSDFLQVIDSNFTATSSRRKRGIVEKVRLKVKSRRKRDASALSIVGPNGIDRADVYIGFILDGYEKFRNINDAIPGLQIRIYSPPVIPATAQVIEYDAGEKEPLQIKGTYMTRGCRINDYVVYVGTGVCANFELTDNQLNCHLPDTEPQSTPNDTIACDKLLNITVVLGYYRYHYGCLKYTYPSNLNLIIGVCVGVGVFLLLTVVVIATVVYYRKSKTTQKGDPPQPMHKFDKEDNAVDKIYLTPVDNNYLTPVDDTYLTPVDDTYLTPVDDTYLTPVDDT